VNDEGAQQIGRRCADAGIGEDLRPAFLYAFSDGRYRSAHDVPVDDLGDLYARLRALKAGEVDLVVDPDGMNAPQLVAGDRRLQVPGSSPGRAPSDVTWRAILGQYKGIGQAKLLRRARDLAAERGIAVPTSLETIDAALNDELRAWLEDRNAGAA